MTSTQPQTLIGDRYLVSVTLTHDAGGVVARGVDTVLKRPVIIKLAAPEHTAAYRAALTATARVGHPAFVGVFDSFQHAGQLVIVQEHIVGQTFADLAQAELPPLEVAQFGRQVTLALAHAHRLGIAHGDLTPAALFRDQWRAARINNLGLPADATYFAAAGNILRTGEAIWTITTPTPADDLRAVGVALWLLLAGLPFPPDNATGNDADWALVPRPVPDALRACIMRLVDTRHPQRVTDAEALLTDLSAVVMGMQSGKITAPPWERAATPTFIPKLVARSERPATAPAPVIPALTPFDAFPEPAPLDTLPTREAPVVARPRPPRALEVGPHPPYPTNDDATWMADEGAQLKGGPAPGSPSYLRGGPARKPSRRAFDLTLWLALALALFLFWLVIGYLAPGWLGR
jgi:serine/threonine protein kinase